MSLRGSKRPSATFIRAHSCRFVVQNAPARILSPTASSDCSKFSAPAGFSDKPVLPSRHTPAFLATPATVNARFKKSGKHFLTSSAENGTRDLSTLQSLGGPGATDGSEARAVQFTPAQSGTYFSFAKKASAVLNCRSHRIPQYFSSQSDSGRNCVDP